jgi:hypothetical protein
MKWYHWTMLASMAMLVTGCAGLDQYLLPGGGVEGATGPSTLETSTTLLGPMLGLGGWLGTAASLAANVYQSVRGRSKMDAAMKIATSVMSGIEQAAALKDEDGKVEWTVLLERLNKVQLEQGTKVDVVKLLDSIRSLSS